MMRQLGAVCLALALAGLAVPAEAGTAVRRACLKSDRAAANPVLCSCIQQVADRTLSRGEQRRAASFFRKPDRVMPYRQAPDGTAKARFWDRYKAFGNAAKASCKS